MLYSSLDNCSVFHRPSACLDRPQRIMNLRASLIPYRSAKLLSSSTHHTAVSVYRSILRCWIILLFSKAAFSCQCLNFSRSHILHQICRYVWIKNVSNCWYKCVALGIRYLSDVFKSYNASSILDVRLYPDQLSRKKVLCRLPGRGWILLSSRSHFTKRVESILRFLWIR